MQDISGTKGMGWQNVKEERCKKENTLYKVTKSSPKANQE